VDYAAQVSMLKGIVQRILREVEIGPFHLWFFFLNFKWKTSQEEHKTIFSGLKSSDKALSDQIDFPAFVCLHKMTYQIINPEI
jgi:hypothetical protein